MPSRLLDLQGHPLFRYDQEAGRTSQWSAVPRDYADPTDAMMLAVSDVCSPGANAAYVAGSNPADNPKVYKISAFAAEVSARRHVRCASGEEVLIVAALLAGGGTTSAAEHALWYGVPGWDNNLAPSLQNTDVATVAAGSTPAATLANVINKYSQLTAAQGYIVHLGVGIALDLAAQGYMYNVDQEGQLVIRATGAPVVVSPYYPTAGAALTGGLTLHASGIEALQGYDSLSNRVNIVGDQILALDFDPSTSVRAV